MANRASSAVALTSSDSPGESLAGAESRVAKRALPRVIQAVPAGLLGATLGPHSCRGVEVLQHVTTSPPSAPRDRQSGSGGQMFHSGQWSGDFLSSAQRFTIQEHGQIFFTKIAHFATFH
eukprot:scaffold77673_cov32-Tisochrysis_lutea.AAC.1